jgi:hypothetical protein
MMIEAHGMEIRDRIETAKPDVYFVLNYKSVYSKSPG